MSLGEWEPQGPYGFSRRAKITVIFGEDMEPPGTAWNPTRGEGNFREERGKQSSLASVLTAVETSVVLLFGS